MAAAAQLKSPRSIHTARIAERERRVRGGLPVDGAHEQAIASANNQFCWADDRVRQLLNEISLLRSASGGR